MKNIRQEFVRHILEKVYSFDQVHIEGSVGTRVIAEGILKPIVEGRGDCLIQFKSPLERRVRFYVYFDKTKSGYSIKFKSLRDHIQKDQLETTKQRVKEVYPEAEVDIYNRYCGYCRRDSIPTLRLRLPNLP